MTNIKPLTNEPAVTIGVAIAGLLGLLKAFGLDLTAEQTEAILIAAPIVTAILIRFKVWSPKGLAVVVPTHTGAGPADIAPDAFEDPTDEPLEDEADEPDEIPDPDDAPGQHLPGR